MIQRSSGKQNIIYFPKTASTVYTAGSLVYPNGTGGLSINTSVSNIPIGIIQKTVASTDVDYAIPSKVPVDVIELSDTFTIDTTGGTASSSTVGNTYNLNSTKDSVDISAVAPNGIARVVSLDSFGKVYVSFLLSGAVTTIAAESFGASPSATGAVNATAIQAAFTAAGVLGGTVSLTTPGTYTVAGSMTLLNKVSFFVGNGVVVQRAANVSAPLIKNRDAAYLIQATAWTRASNVVTVTDVGHTFVVGQKIFLPPSRFTDTTFGGVVTVTSIATGSWTYASIGSNGAGGTSLQHIPVIPITRTITTSSLAAITVNSVKYIQVTDAVGDIPVGAQVYISTDNTADSAFWGMVDAAVVTTTGWVFKVPNGTAGLPLGNLTINYSVFTQLTGQGIIDGNYPNQGGGNGIMSLSPCLFSNVSFHRVDGGIKIQNSNIRCISYFNPSNVYIDCVVDNTKVGIEIEGGYKAFRVARMSGAAQQNSTWDGSATKQALDDFFALTNVLYTGDGSGGAQNYDNVSSPYGLTGSFDIKIDELVAYNCLNGFKMTGDISAPFDRTHIGVIRMYGLDPNRGTTGTAVSIVDDGPHLKGTSYNFIKVDEIIWDDDTSTGTSQRDLNHNATGNSGTLILSGLKQQSTMAQGIAIAPATQSVTTITTDNTTCTVTTASAHGYVTGQRVTITGVTSDVTFNGTWQISVSSSTVFTFLYTKVGPVTGTIVVCGSLIKLLKLEYMDALPAAAGSRTLVTLSGGTIDMIEILGVQASLGVGVGAPTISSAIAFFCPTMKVGNLIYSAITNITGTDILSLAGNHKSIVMDNWHPRGLDTTNANGFMPVSLVRFLNTTIPQTTSIYINNCVLKGANVFRDNGSVIGATTLSFFLDNTEMLNSGATNLWNFSGSATTQINIFATESCRFPTSGLLTSTTPNIRLNGPMYAKLSTLAGKFTGQVDGDTCISMEAVNGLPGTPIRVRWSATLAKWVSISPVASNTVTLNGATAVVVTQALTQATSRIILSTRTTAGGVDSAAFVSAITAGTNFSVKASAGDTGQVLWDMYGTN